MKERLREVLSLAEAEANWFNDTARHFEQFAAKLDEEDRAEWDLLASVYRERAQVILGVAEKVHQSLTTDGGSQLELENI